MDDVFTSDASKDGEHDAPLLTESEESEESLCSDDLPDLVEDQGSEEDRVGNDHGLNGRWLSARSDWWQVVRRRVEPWLLDDVILSYSSFLNE